MITAIHHTMNDKQCVDTPKRLLTYWRWLDDSYFDWKTRKFGLCIPSNCPQLASHVCEKRARCKLATNNYHVYFSKLNLPTTSDQKLIIFVKILGKEFEIGKKWQKKECFRWRKTLHLLTVGLLEASAGRLTTELLGLAAAGIRDLFWNANDDETLKFDWKTTKC